MESNLALRAAVLTSLAALVSFAQQPPTEPHEPLKPANGEHVYVPVPVYKPRVFLQANSRGNNWNANRDQSMEMSKDFERDCPEVRITLNQSATDYTVLLNHIEHGLVRDNQFQVQRECARPKEQPFICDHFSETNPSDYLKNSCKDRPECDNVEQNDGSDGGPSEREDARNDSDQAFNQERPVMCRDSKEGDYVE